MRSGRSSQGGRSATRRFAVGLARAFGGAVVFSLPLLMTMEMWWLGSYLPRTRLAVLVVAWLPILYGLSYHAGFEEGGRRPGHDAVAALVAYAVGFLTSGAALGLIAVLGPGQPAGEVVGQVALQAGPAAVGALLARTQLGGGHAERPERGRFARYAGELFLMMAGALFLALNVAPTEEMVVIASQMTPWHALGLAVVSLTLMHAFVYVVEFRGQEERGDASGWSLFARYTVVGYALVLALSALALWLLGRTEGLAPEPIAMTTVVLAFPAAVGAAAARLIL